MSAGQGSNCVRDQSAVRAAGLYFVRFERFRVNSTGTELELAVATPLCKRLQQAEAVVDDPPVQECRIVLRKTGITNGTAQVFIAALNGLNHLLQLFHPRLKSRIV
jgi:hypothetical protein